MNVIIKESERNVRTHLKKERQAFFGIFMGPIPGGTCRIQTSDRSYRVDYIIDEKIERFFVDAYPQIVCEKPYRQMMHAYVNEKTSGYKSGRVDIDDDNGEVRIRVEASIVDKPVSVKDIKDMEHLAIHICDGLEKRLDKMAHGVYFKEDDPNLMSATEKKLAELKNKLAALSDDDDFDASLEEIAKMMDSDNDEEMEDDTVPSDETYDDDDEDDAAEDIAEEGEGEANASTDENFDDLFPGNETDDDD